MNSFSKTSNTKEMYLMRCDITVAHFLDECLSQLIRGTVQRIQYSFPLTLYSSGSIHRSRG